MIKWINIKKDQPKEGQHCLIYGNGNITAGTFNMSSLHGNYFACDGDDFDTSNYDDTACIDEEHVTYWFPVDQIKGPK